MPKIGVNLDDVKEYIEPGWYHARVVGCEQRESKSGNPYLAWALEIYEPDNPAVDGSKVYLNTTLQQGKLGMLKRFLEACQFDWDPEGFHTEDVIGYEVEIQLSVEEYQGRKKNSVDNWRKAI